MCTRFIIGTRTKIKGQARLSGGVDGSCCFAAAHNARGIFPAKALKTQSEFAHCCENEKKGLAAATSKVHNLCTIVFLWARMLLFLWHECF